MVGQEWQVADGLVVTAASEPAAVFRARAAEPVPRRVRVAAVAAAAWGAVLLSRPRRIAGDGPAAVVLTRLLGARYLVQALALAGVRPPPTCLVNAVDALHAVSMLPFAASRRYRRPALLSAAVAVGLIAVNPASSGSLGMLCTLVR